MSSPYALPSGQTHYNFELLSPEGGVLNSVGREPYVRRVWIIRAPKGRGFFSVRVVGLAPYAIEDAAFGAEKFKIIMRLPCVTFLLY